MTKQKTACAIMFAMEKVGRRWALLVLRELLDGPQRFSKLNKSIPWVSGRSLTRVLKKLEFDGLILRKVDGGRPPKVSYSLSGDDPMLRDIIDAMFRWGTKEYLKQGGRRRSGDT